MITLRLENCEAAQRRLRELGGDAVQQIEETSFGLRLVLDRSGLYDLLARIKTDAGLHFEYFIDVTAVDYKGYSQPPEDRFAVIYILLSPILGIRLQIECSLPESDPSIASVSDLFEGARWGEREVYDMYGIVFRGHADLRRILLPDDYQGFPLRKDYPLKGRGERASFPIYRATPGRAAGVD